MKLRSKIAVAVAIVAVQGGIGFAIWRVEKRRETAEGSFFVEPVEARMAPALQWISADGTRGSLDDARGVVVVLHFWATWCPPCVAELPGLLALGRSEDVRVIAVSLDEDWGVVREFFTGTIPPEVVRASADDVMTAYGVSTLPETWLVGADGLLRLRIAGERDWRTDRARAVMRGIADE